MKNEEVLKLKPLDRFIYWIRERHQIYLRRRAGKPKPWTDDEVMQRFFFTNPYRENDKVTVWFRENIREPLADSTAVIFATIAFRWFNLPDTGKLLIGNGQPIFAQGRSINPGGSLLLSWDSKNALTRLGKVRDNGEKIFTGAFMINSPGGEPKLEAIVRRITNVWEDRDSLTEFFADNTLRPSSLTLQEAHSRLTEYDGLGGFMAYEVVCDLRYTCWLKNAPDIMTWCHVGPGANRGLHRILEVPFDKGNNSTTPPRLKDELGEMRKLLAIITKALPKMPKFEMREIEHASCEFDKYERLLFNDGRAKRTFDGTV